MSAVPAALSDRAGWALGVGLSLGLALAVTAPVPSAWSSPSSMSAGQQHHAAVRRVIEREVLPWLQDAVVIQAIRLQNERHSDLTQADIAAFDARWRRETESPKRPLIDAVLSSDLSRYLHGVRTRSQGLLTEIFVMDAVGLNVGQSDMTSDFWQGDEEKWQRTCLGAPDAIFIDEVQEDESTQQFQSQVSMAVADPESGTVIGCITVGIDVDLAMDLVP